MSLADDDVQASFDTLVNEAFDANLDGCQQKLRERSEQAKENLRKRAGSVQGPPKGTLPKHRLRASQNEESVGARASALGWSSGLGSLTGGQVCSPRVWLASTPSINGAQAVVDELRELRNRYQANHPLRQQWEHLGPRFVVVPLDTLSPSDRLRVPASIERLRSRADTSEWARLAREQFLPVVRSLLEEPRQTLSATATSVSFQQYHGVSPPANVHTLRDLAEWLGNKWLTFSELRESATPDRPGDVYARVVYARAAVESAIDFLRGLELADVPQVTRLNQNPMSIDPDTGEYLLVDNHAELVANAKNNLGQVLDYVRSKLPDEAMAYWAANDQVHSRLANLVAALNSLLDSGQNSEGDSPESFAFEDIEPGGDVHSAVVALEACCTGKKLPWEGRRCWIELQRICRHEPDERKRVTHASDAAQQLAEWVESLRRVQGQRQQSDVVTDTHPGNDPNGSDKEYREELRPAAKKAWASWQLIEHAHAQTPKDRDGYDWLKEQPDESFVGELAGYIENIPSFGTWQRQLRTARNHFDARKKNRRTGRTFGGSVVRISEI
ncbi:hypothetical protein [Aeoliella sp. SH292]|uniref:hypothetical protein n=1 Tax=Aeoliella sp. SH292 TaxID=3454464 RepID=UPI003F97B608